MTFGLVEGSWMVIYRLMYACHVRVVNRMGRERAALTVEESSPRVAYWTFEEIFER